MMLSNVKVDFHVNGWISEEMLESFVRRNLVKLLNEGRMSFSETVDLTYL